MCRWCSRALIALAILGVIIYAATVELERRMTGWAHRFGDGPGVGVWLVQAKR
jgi:hypothetical protein